MLLCLLAGTAIAGTNAPARDYTIINFDTGLTTTILEVGTTSLTFVVEWSPDVDTPRTLFLLGRLYPETQGWGGLYELEIDKAQSVVAYLDWSSRFPKEVDLNQRKAIFEVLYRVIPWYHMEPEKSELAQRAFFSVQWPVEPEDWGDVYGNDNHEIFGPSAYELGIVTNAENRIQEQESSDKQATITTDKTLNNIVVEDEQNRAMASSPNRLWLYLTILPCILAILYLMRRKKE